MSHKIEGTAGDDTLQGTEGADTIMPHGGDDLVYGLGGDDYLVGGGGKDTLIGGDGNDVISANLGSNPEGADSAVGGAGDDFLFVSAGDTAFGGAGDDLVHGTGGGGASLEGGLGHDELNFTFVGGDGAYTGDLGFLADLRDGEGDVAVDGATIGGFERGEVSLLFYASAHVTLAANVRHFGVTGTLADDHIVGNAGADTLMGYGGHDTLDGAGGDDQLESLSDASLLLGRSGDDSLRGDGTLKGGDGADLLKDNGGDAVLAGGAGVDTLVAGYGHDELQGGQGRDVYQFNAAAVSPADQPDHIHDADFGVVDLSAIDADPSTAQTDDAFTLVHAFTGHAGELVIAWSKADGMTHVEADNSGDGQPDLVILIDGKHIDPADYVL